MEYTGDTVGKDDQFYEKISEIIGPYTYRSKKNYKKYERNNYNSYEKYERYERYQKYEKFERKNISEEKEFSFDSASDFEKSKFCGKTFGLQGIVKKSDLKKKYIELITQYHPDKVSGLGLELVKLAEKKSKEINQAYEWLKSKYDL